MTSTFDGLAWPHCAHGRAKVTGEALNVRETAGMGGKVLGQLVAGQIVAVWAVVDDWWLVQTDGGVTGWSAAWYLRPIGDLTP